MNTMTKLKEINMSAIENTKGQIPLYPIRFEPIYQYRIWGGRQLADLLTAPLPGNDPIGEAWVLSDRDDHASLVANGPLKGLTIGQMFKQSQEQLMGKLAGKFNRFPLLLKFLDAHEMLSVQVHPSDMQKDLIPEGEHGKTEAWVVLESTSESKIYAGLKPKTTAGNLKQSIKSGTIEDHLSSFTPKPGDGIFLPAGTVHSLGGNIVVFEVQQNSDVTFRLYDWNHIDAKTGKPRDLQIDQAIACIDFAQGEKAPVNPVSEEQHPVLRERLFQCEHFRLWRLSGKLPFTVGEKDTPRVLVCIDGEGELEHNNTSYAIRKGDVWLLPAIVGSCMFCPNATVSLLEIALPE
jgi:mannose-6-phosphate isomerase